MSVDYGLTADEEALMSMTDEEWHRTMWLEMWRLIGIEVVSHADRLRGHVIYWDKVTFRYSDDHSSTLRPRRDCGKCHKPDTIDGHDACLGTLPGVMNACCGHGNQDEAYIQWVDGSCIRGFDAALEQQRLVDQAKHRAFSVWFAGITGTGILALLDDAEALQQEWLLMWRLIGQEEAAMNTQDRNNARLALMPTEIRTAILWRTFGVDSDTVAAGLNRFERTGDLTRRYGHLDEVFPTEWYEHCHPETNQCSGCQVNPWRPEERDRMGR